jgi:hypothetical protein
MSNKPSPPRYRHKIQATTYREFAMTEIDPSTVRAYRETDYCVDAPVPFVLHIGVACAPLAQLYRRHHADCCAFVTACNPYSQLVGDDANAARQLELARELRALELTFFDSVGRHPAGGWPAESGFLALEISRATAKALGEKYEQNAILWCGPDAIPELVLIR